MADAPTCKDEKRLLPAPRISSGEYGYKDLYLGVPVVIGAGGVEKVVTIELTADEKAMLDKSAAAVRELIEASRSYERQGVRRENPRVPGEGDPQEAAASPSPRDGRRSAPTRRRPRPRR